MHFWKSTLFFDYGLLKINFLRRYSIETSNRARNSHVKLKYHPETWCPSRSESIQMILMMIHNVEGVQQWSLLDLRSITRTRENEQ